MLIVRGLGQAAALIVQPVKVDLLSNMAMAIMVVVDIPAIRVAIVVTIAVIVVAVCCQSEPLALASLPLEASL